MAKVVFRKDFNFATKLFHTAIFLIYCISRILGVACFSFDCRSQYVKKSWQACLYSSCLLALVTAFMPFALHILYTEMTFLRQNELITYVGYMRYGILMLCALATLYMQMHNRNGNMDCINQMLECRDILHMSINNVMCSHKLVIWTITAKCLTFMLQVHWILFLIIKDEASKSFRFLFTLLYVQYCHMILVTTLNILFYGSWIIGLIAQELNQNLLGHLKRLKYLSYHRMGNHRIRRQYLIHQLEQVLRSHWKTYKLSRTFMHLYGWPILFFLTFVIVESVTQIFIMYFVAKGIALSKNDFQQSNSRVAASPMRNDSSIVVETVIGVEKKRKIGVVINPWAVLHVFGITWDMFLILLMFNKMRVNFKETRFIFCSNLWRKSLLSSANRKIDECEWQESQDDSVS